MRATTTKSAYWTGFRVGLPFMLVVTPFAILFGVVATEAGLSVLKTMVFSVSVIAGAAQFTALQLMQEHAPTLIVLVSALAVNLRLAMYSAALTPHLGAAPFWLRGLIAFLTVDQNYACSVAAYERNPGWALPQRVAFFFGTSTPVVPMWCAMSLVGALIGTRIPESFALDFAVPITFLALIAPMLRSRAHVAAAVVAVGVALAMAWLPYNLGLLVAGTAGMIAGAWVELRLTRGATA